MNVARPIVKKEYDAFRAEIYEIVNGVESVCRFTVPMDADPTLRPKNLTEKMAQTQACKDRMVVILNRAILNEAYWKTVIKRVDARFESEIARAYLDPSMKELKNQELRSGQATSIAEEAVLKFLFDNKGTYDEQTALIHKNAQDAVAFLSEVKNIYDNLSDTAVALAVQLKSVMVNAKVYGDPSGEIDQKAHTLSARG
jgi:hypothetical protein